MNISDLLKDPEKAKEILNLAIRTQNKELVEILIPIAKDPYLTCVYAIEMVKGKIKDEWEDIIAQDAKNSYSYAEFVLEKPFPKGEDAIAKDPKYSYYYVRDVLRSPFPKGEDAIAKNPEYSYKYAKYFLKNRFIKGEKEIVKDNYLFKEYVEFLKNIGKLDEFLKDHPEVKDKV